MRTLIVCEKNDAAKQIATVLAGGKQKRRLGGGAPVYEYEDENGPVAVMGLRGHILELDFDKAHKRWSIQSDKLHALVDAPVIKSDSEPKIVATLRQRAKTADRIIVATDYDREGELIGVEALEALGTILKGKEIRRAKYSSFTKKEVLNAFANLQDVDHKLAQAGEARQMIDLAWGAALTRYLTIAGARRGQGVLSVGRVQTPTLGLIVDREKERQAFVEDPYWEVSAELGPETFTANHVRNGYVKDKENNFAGYGDNFPAAAEAEAARAAIAAAGTATVTDVEHREGSRKPPVPFSTTGFQQAASGIGFGVKRAMDIAQKLYLAGLISYHRTENTVYPSTLELDELVAMLAARGPIKAEAQWVQSHRRETPTRGKKETTDHPPIYPTALPGAEHKLREPELRVWELIARRFLATLSPDARVHNVSAQFESGGERLRASGQTTIEAGWRRAMGPFFKGKETPLPKLEVGLQLPVESVEMESKVTTPPDRYGQGGLIAEMEKLGIGTKATRHETIQRLIDRQYITENPVEPTRVGFAVTDALEEYARTITEPEMTAKLEEEMTQIESGDRTLDDTLADSRSLLHGAIDTLLANLEPIQTLVRAALEEDAHVGQCPECGNKLLQRKNRFGGRFIGCKGYPDCSVTYNLPARGLLEFSDEGCPDCNAPFVSVNDRGRKQEMCVNGECPTRIEAAEAEKQELGTCPTCKSGTLESQRSRNWKRFVKCTECEQSYPLPQRGDIHFENAHCDACGSPRVDVLTKNRKPWNICINMDCTADKDAAEAEKQAKAEERAKKAAKKAAAAEKKAET